MVENTLSVVPGKFDNANKGYMTFPSGQWNEVLSSPSWTVDLWVYPRPAVAFDTILCLGSWGGSSGFSIIRLEPKANSNFCTYWLDNKYNHVVIGENIPLLGAQWSHIAFVYDNGRMAFYINGQKMREDDFAITSCGSINAIGKGWTTDGNTTAASYFDELRISNIARWKNNFTPPAKPYN